MLDPMMTAFDAEMRAKPRPRPRRASTRRAELDNLSAPGAQRLAQIIKAYWDAAGFTVHHERVVAGHLAPVKIHAVRPKDGPLAVRVFSTTLQ
jgi:hypothetical protein